MGTSFRRPALLLPLLLLTATAVASAGIEMSWVPGKGTKRPKRLERYSEWPATLRWTASQSGALRPGEDLRIAWTSDAGAPELAGVDEWEAFASADGGK